MRAAGRRLRLGVYAASHALVDGVCAFGVFSIAYTYGSDSVASATAFVLFYNFCAFVLQPFVGLAADLVPRPRLFAAAGCAVVGAFGFFAAWPMAAAALMGVGNAFFHVGGGLASILPAPKKATAAGVFIAPGAVGLSLGGAAAGLAPLGSAVHPAVCLLTMLVPAAAIFLLREPGRAVPPDPAPEPPPSGRLRTAVIAVFFVTVLVRSSAGFALPFSWNDTALAALAIAAAAATGKAAGGFAGDRFGYAPAALAGLVLSAVLLSAGRAYAAPSLAGLVLFNMTMPLVLASLMVLFPGGEGFAFGLHSALLFPGLFLGPYIGSPAALGVIILASAALLAPALYLFEKKYRQAREVSP